MNNLGYVGFGRPYNATALQPGFTRGNGDVIRIPSSCAKSTEASQKFCQAIFGQSFVFSPPAWLEACKADRIQKSMACTSELNPETATKTVANLW